MSQGIIATGCVYRIVDASGNPLSGAKLYTYEAGTTTPLAVYTDGTLTTPATNPVVMNANGEATIWFGLDDYKLVEKTSADVTLRTVDNISGNFLTRGAADDLYTHANKPIPLLTSSYNAGTGVYTLTPSPAITAYEDGQQFMFVISADNTYSGQPSVNVSGLGNKLLSDWAGGDVTVQNSLRSGRIIEIVYYAADNVFRLLSPAPMFQLIKTVNATSWSMPTDGAYQKYVVTTASYTGMWFEITVAPDPAYGPWQSVAWGAGTKTYVRAEHATTGVLTLKQKVVTDTTGAGVDSSLTIASVYQLMIPS